MGGGNGSKNMPQVDKEKVKEFLNVLKIDMRAMIEKHANEAAALSVNSTDPHLPIIACVQMALATAGLQYLLTCGVEPSEGLSGIIDSCNKAMQAWLQALVGEQPKQQQ
jgi:hypothetical protein